jgi:flagellin
MGLRIQNNVEAFNAHRNLSATASKAAKAMEKLSSGYRVNRAADDAAGLAISEKMRGQIGGLAQAQRNAQDGISLVQTAEGAFGEVHAMLQRVRDLTVQYKNGTLSQDDKDAVIGEVAQLAQEIREIGDKTQFNGKDLLKGATFNFQVGANDGEQVSATGGTLTTTGGVATVLLVGYADAAAVAAGTAMTTGANLAAMRTAMDNLAPSILDTAITNVSKIRSDFGAVQNRLEHRLANLATYQENLTASESRIRDVDMAAEMTKFTKLNILQQAGTSMLAQANQAPQGVLSLLR